MCSIDGEDVIVARLGPDTVCGTETLLQGRYIK